MLDMLTNRDPECHAASRLKAEGMLLNPQGQADSTQAQPMQLTILVGCCHTAHVGIFHIEVQARGAGADCVLQGQKLVSGAHGHVLGGNHTHGWLLVDSHGCSIGVAVTAARHPGVSSGSHINGEAALRPVGVGVTADGDDVARVN